MHFFSCRMPLSSKERSAKCRAKMKTDCPASEEKMKKERERVAAYRKRKLSEMNEEQLLKHKKSEIARIGKYRTKRTDSLDPNSSPYVSKTQASRAFNRAREVLPKSPRKRKVIAYNLAKESGLTVSRDEEPPQKIGGNKGLNYETEKSVISFYCLDDISWQAPGRKDRVILRWRDCHEKKQKTIIQARYMMTSLAEAYEQFCQRSQTKISRSTFCSLRPKHVKLFDSFPNNVCLCIYHENVRLLLDALKPYIPLATKTFDFSSSIVCDTMSEKCMSQKCLTCKDKLKIYNPDSSYANMKVKYYQWQKSGVTDKVQCSATVQNVFEELVEQTPKFLLHQYVKRKQSAFAETLRQSVNGSKIMIQLDFAENASLIHQNEIQAVHWTHKQATIFTAHAWISSGISESMAIISDDPVHNKLQVHTYVRKIISYLKEKYPAIKDVIIFSDGCAAQFKQRYLFSNLYSWEKQFGINMSWNFFATSHGKGVIDGHGGTIKRSVWRYVKSNKDGPGTPTAKAFFDVAVQRNPSIKLFFIPRDEIVSNEVKLEEFWKGVVPIPNTQKIHTVSAQNETEIRVGFTSTSTLETFKIRDENVSLHLNAENECIDSETNECTDSETDSSSDNENSDSEYANALFASSLVHDESLLEVQKTETTFRQYLSTQNFVFSDTPKDGNCFFWAISRAFDVTGANTYTHTALRKKATDYMESISQKQRDEISNFLTKPFAKYIQDMKKNGEYADHITVKMLSEVLRVKIVILNAQGNTTVGQDGPNIYVGFMPEINHYTAVKPVEKILDCEIEVEKYYAVYYTEPLKFYVGRVIKIDCQCGSVVGGHLKMKFFEENLLTKEFEWPRKLQLECVPVQFLFAGPLQLEGSGPFRIESSNLKEKFEKIKSQLKN